MIRALHPASLDGVSVAVDARAVSCPGTGFESYLKAAVQCLLDMRARVWLLTNFPTQSFEELFPTAEWVAFGSRRNLIWDQIDLPRFLRRGRFELYWAPANNGIPLLPVNGTWTISTTHDLVPLRLPKMYIYGRPAFALPYLVWTITSMLRSDTVLTVSESSARDIRRLFWRRATVIPPVFGGLPSTAPEGLVPEQIFDKAFVVYNGGLDPRKNVPNLLRGFAIAARDWPELTLVVMGHGYGVFEAAIEELGIADKVVRTGYVDDETRSAIVKAAVAVAYPSLYEGFGLPLVEAFALGTPVLTAPNSSLSEVAGDAALYVDPLDPVSIAKGLISLRDPETCSGLRARGEQRLERFDPVVLRERLATALSTAARHQADRSSRKRRLGRNS